MLNVFACPNCGRKLETNLGEGQSIPCPSCDETFTLSREHAVSRNAFSEILFRLAIPIGYVLFVAVPLGLTIWYLTTQMEDQPKEAADATQAQGGQNEPKPPAQRPVRPRKDTKQKAEIEGPEEDVSPAPKQPVVPVKPEPKPKGPPKSEPSEPATPAKLTELAVAPEPREIEEVFVAPDPHEAYWKFPPSQFASGWEKTGAVDVRIAGLVVTKVPWIDANDRVSEPAAAMLVILLEVKLNTEGKRRTLTSWRDGRSRHAVIYLEGDFELSPVVPPKGSKPYTGLPVKQPLPDDGTAVKDVLLFVIPPAETKELSLRLTAERCGEIGDIWFKIPASAWKK